MGFTLQDTLMSFQSKWDLFLATSYANILDDKMEQNVEVLTNENNT